MHGIESLARTGQHLTTLVSEKSSDTNLNAINLLHTGILRIAFWWQSQGTKIP